MNYFKKKENKYCKIKNHKIIRIVFRNNEVDFSEITLGENTLKILKKNKTIIHDKKNKKNKTPYSNFYPPVIKKNRKCLASHRTQYDSFFGFPLHLAITTNNHDSLTKLLYQGAFLNKLEENIFTSLQREEILEKVKKSCKKKHNKNTIVPLLIFHSDHLLKKINSDFSHFAVVNNLVNNLVNYH